MTKLERMQRFKSKLSRNSRTYFTLVLVVYLFLNLKSTIVASQATTDLRDSVARLHESVLDIWVSFPDEAMEYGERALNISKQLNDSVLISKSLRLISGVFYYQGNLSKSLSFNQDALAIALERNDSTLIANGYNNIGLLYYDLGSYTLAYEYLLRSLSIKEKTNEKYGKAALHVNIGLIFMRLGYLDEANSNFEKAYILAEEIGNKDDELYALNNTAASLLQVGKLGLALQHFQWGLELGVEIENINWTSVSLRGIGEVYMELNKTDSAEYYLGRALEKSKSITDRKGMSEAYYLLARLYFQRGDPEKALEFLQESDSYAVELELRYQNLQNLKLYADIYKGSNNTSQEAIYLRKYISMQDTLFEDVVARNIKIVPLKLKEEEDRMKLADQQAKLQSQSIITDLFTLAIILVVPLVVFLVILLRKNAKKAEALQNYNNDLRKAQSLLITQEKMASLGVLAAGVGHEINNPLNFIKNGVGALSHYLKIERGETDPQVDTYLRIVDEGVIRATKIVSSLSHFSRAGESKTEVCKINEIIENCLLILHNKIRDRIQIVTVFDEEAKLIGNEGRLHQAILNIVANAAQAIEESGTIEIVTKREAREVVVEISDDGAGISEKNLTKIRDPFFTTKPPGVGTGLGLYITSNIIEEHNGKMEVQSKLGVGTRFIITLPLP